MALSFRRSPDYVVIEEELCAVRHAWSLRGEEFVSKFTDPREQKAARLLIQQLPLIAREGLIPRLYPLQGKLWLSLALGGLEILKDETIAPHPCGHTLEKHRKMLQQVASTLTAKSPTTLN